MEKVRPSGVNAVGYSADISAWLIPPMRNGEPGTLKKLVTVIVIITMMRGRNRYIIVKLFFRKPRNEDTCFIFIWFPVLTSCISCFLKRNSRDKEKKNSNHNPTNHTTIRIRERNQADSEPKHTFSEIIRMTRISIESRSEYLSWFFDFDEFFELQVCNGFKYQSGKCKENSKHKTTLLCHSGLDPESSIRKLDSCIRRNDAEIHYQYRCSYNEQEDHLKQIYLKKTSHIKIPSIPPLFSPFCISWIFFSFFPFTKTYMRNDTDSPQHYQSCN